MHKPVIGISCGDINGIGTEVIIKTFADHRILEHCTPVIFASSKLINFYRKSIPDINFTYQNIKDFNRVNHKQINIFNCWEEEVMIQPGQLNETGGRYAVRSLKSAMQALMEGHLQGIVTAPLHKSNVQSADFNYTGHTPYLKAAANVTDVLMLLYTEKLRVGLVTEHIALKHVHEKVTRENIYSKLLLLHQSLRRDFGIDSPKIAVLGMNPHAGDEGLLGKEEEQTIKPAINDARQQKILAFG